MVNKRFSKVNQIMEHVSHKCGISISNAWLSDLEYADDVVLLAERRELLVLELQSMEEESSEFGYTFHGQRRRSRTWELDLTLRTWLLTVTSFTE